MIVVLADDLSGAAELAGAALQHGLSAEVQTRFDPASQADVVCVDTDSRSLPAGDAARAVGGIARSVAAAHPEWVYKKCDSVLRGNVLEEIRAILATNVQTRAVLVSANPSRGRTIRGGDYFVDGQPLHTTAFASDPEHPRLTSRITELLGGGLAGIHTPDAETTADLERHAATVDASVLPAGGVEFFTALLRRRVVSANAAGTAIPSKAESARRGPRLMVCGSAAAWAKGRGAEAARRGWSIETMPREMLTGCESSSESNAWAQRIARELDSGRDVLAAVGCTQTHAEPARLAHTLASAVAAALHHSRPAILSAEGGATAAAVARALGWTRFAVVRELAGGVVELLPVASRAPHFIIKVGSYDWPAAAW